MEDKPVQDSVTEKDAELTPDQRCTNIFLLEMNLSKLTYFLCEGYMGSILPYLNIFFVTIGLTAAQSGLITGISFAVAAVAGPLWASMIDSTGHRKIFFFVLCLGAIVSIFLMPWFCQAVATYQFHRICFNVSNATHPPHPPLPHPPFPHPVIVNGTACFHRRILTNSSILFYTLMALNIVSKVFFVTLPHYIDGLVMTVVKTRRQPTTFGEQRVFGVVGFGTGNFLTGLAVEHYTGGELSPYVAAFYVFLPYAVLLLPTGLFLIKQIPQDTDLGLQPAIRKQNFLNQLKAFFKKSDTIMHMCSVVVSGTALNIFFNFLVLFMIKDLHAEKLTITLTFLVCMLTQLIGYPLSSRVIRLFGGPIPAITIGIFSYLPRYLLMSFVTKPWWTLPIQLFEPFGLAFSWAAMMEYTYEIAPRDISMSVINMVGITHFVATSALANIVGGIAFHAYGGRFVFRGMAVLCGVWSFLMLWYHRPKFFSCPTSNEDLTEQKEKVKDARGKDNVPGAYANSVEP